MAKPWSEIKHKRDEPIASEPVLRILSTFIGTPHGCVDPEGWPEVEITVTYIAENTDDLETVRRLAEAEAETLGDELAARTFAPAAALQRQEKTDG